MELTSIPSTNEQMNVMAQGMRSISGRENRNFAEFSHHEMLDFLIFLKQDLNYREPGI